MGENITMEWAWRYGAFEFHFKNIGGMEMMIKSPTEIELSNIYTAPIDLGFVKKFCLHGWLCWVAWGVLSLVQLFSSRYFKHFWRSYMWVHVVSGLGIVALTTAMCVVAFQEYDWYKISSDPLHVTIGIIVWAIGLATPLFGFLAKV